MIGRQTEKITAEQYLAQRDWIHKKAKIKYNYVDHNINTWYTISSGEYHGDKITLHSVGGMHFRVASNQELTIQWQN